MKINVDIETINGRIHVYLLKSNRSDAFKQYLTKIKAIPGRFFHSTDPKHWSVPQTELKTLKECFNINKVIGEAVEDESFAQNTLSISEDFIQSMKVRPFNFQIIGINFLTNVKQCLLGDTMGLGKTVQIIGAIHKLTLRKPSIRALIIAPTSLKYQWVDELKKFLHDPEYILIDKNPKKRKKLYEKARDDKPTFMITNYELARIDLEELQKTKWDVIVLDECQKIKNHLTQTYKALIKIPSEYRWAATGTPVQNRPDELFNIFSWINPKILGGRWAFRHNYFVIGRKYGKDNIVLGYRNLPKLHQIIKPYTIRRLTKEVAPELPDLIISNRYIEMTRDQERVNEILSQEAYDLIVKTGEYNEVDEVGNLIKKHPQTDLIKGLYTVMQIVADAPEMLKMSKSKLTQKYAELFRDFSSPKLDELYDIVSDYLDEDEDNKVLVFSRFERIQGLMVKRLSRLANISIINGKLSAAEKHEALSAFKTLPDHRILIASDSMNYGVNCQEASLVIQLDLPYNPAIYHQRNGRIHRIGTEHSVLNVINLISLNSIDERIYDILIKKEELSKTIIDPNKQLDNVFDLEIGIKLVEK